MSAWSTPPEFAPDEIAHLPDTDWFAFGMLAARLVANLEHLPASSAALLRASVVEHLSSASAKDLGAREIDLLLRLIAPDPLARLRHFEEIAREIQEIERLLSGDNDGRSQALVVVVDPKPGCAKGCWRRRSRLVWRCSASCWKRT